MDFENDPGWQYLRQTREQMIKDQSKPFDSKKNCWVPDEEEGYLEATIKETKGDMVTVTCGGPGNEKTVKKDLLQDMNPPKFEKTEDMSNLSMLNDASVLHNLRARYKAMLIYTYSGLFCVVINPYKRLPIYTDSVARFYMGKRRTEMPPHLFAVSDEAYRNMLQDHENQSMLITGESGAGKTENTKKVIAYFASVGASQQEAADANKPAVESKEKKVTLEDQIVQTNPVLEAFGNAKTVRNNNSSRFGKFIRIHFSKQGRLASCDIEHYLLEKSRVIRQAPGERCYHIFYQIYSDYKPELKKELLLDLPIKDYWFVAQAELTIDGINDTEEFQLTDEAFDILKFSPQEKMDCYKCMSALMHMGNMKFKQRPREEQAEADGTDEAEKASAMYGIDPEEFMKAMLKPRVKVGTEWVNKGQNMEQVNWSVGAMAKGLYSRIFNWLVKKCNQTLDQKGISRDFFIGVLDIAGFEIFDFNSFEQLWINFVNEKLQQFFNHHMFVLEQEEYKREGIDWVFIDFGLDLQACIELIEKPMGIISMLDEECIVPKASDATLAAKLVDTHLGKHPNFVKPGPPKGKQAEAHFAMKHYAGTVRYNVSNWLEKNKDPLNDTVVSVMKASKANELLVEVWQDYTTQEEAAALEKKGGAAGGGKKKGKSGSFMTVSMLYRESLNKLMGMLHTTHPHFIRCIIPNEKKTSGMIDASLVLNQLTCNGVLEGIRICRKGFPNRMLHPDFVQRYAILAADEAAKNKADSKKAADEMAKRLIRDKVLVEDNFRVGLTKVFFKAGIVAHLEDYRDQRLSTLITGLQAQVRWSYQQIEKKRNEKKKDAFLVIQRNIRQWGFLRQWAWYKLYGKVQPMVKEGKVQEQLDQLGDQVTAWKDQLLQASEDKKQLKDGAERMSKEIADLSSQLEKQFGSNKDIEERIQQLDQSTSALESRVSDANQRLEYEEQVAQEILQSKKRVEAECAEVKKAAQELDLSLKKAEAEKIARDNNIRALHEEMKQQDESISKLSKERKAQEEANKKLQEDLHSAEEANLANQKLRQRLAQTIEDVEQNLDREKRNRADADKARRKAEGEMKIAQETFEELSKQKADLENALRRKENDLHNLGMKLEDEQSGVSKLQRSLKEDDARLNDLLGQLAEEKEARGRSDRSRQELQTEFDETADTLDEQQRALATQIEFSKKKDGELAKLRRDNEEGAIKFNEALSALKKKGQDGAMEMNDQIEQVQKNKNRLEKEKAQLQREFEEASQALDIESKARSEQEKVVKNHEVRLLELRLRADEQSRMLTELISSKGRLGNENSELARQVSEFDHQILSLSKTKIMLSNQLDESKRLADDESRERQNLSNLSRNLQRDLDHLKESVEDEIAAKGEATRHLSRAQNELEIWKSKFESEGLIGADEFDEVRRRQNAKVVELQDALDAANAKIVQLENSKTRLSAEADANRQEAEHHATAAASLEKKQKAFDKVIDEWKKKVDDLYIELDNAQRDSRAASGEAHKLRGQHDALADQSEGLKRENKSLTDEIRDMTETLGDGGRQAHALQKHMRRLEVDKDELQRALDEAEAALEAEESKANRCQIEIAQIRQEIEKRISEKEEEFENARKAHQNHMEGIQMTLDSESKMKNDLLRIKKKLESDISELEIGLDHANQANEDAQKNIKRHLDQIRELQAAAEEEHKRCEEFRELYAQTERKLAAAKSEQEDLITKLDALERSRRQHESNAHEAQEHNNELNAQNVALTAAKNQLDSEINLLKSDISEAQVELAGSEERGRRAIVEAAKLADDLRHEQERAQQLERFKKQLDSQVKDLQERADVAEAAVIKGGQKAVLKAEARLKSLQVDYENETRRSIETNKALSRADRRVRELDFQVAEDRKNYDKLQELVEKLHVKLKGQKKALEEAEEQATGNLNKYKTVQMALENAEERADAAETNLVRIRSRARAAPAPAEK